MRNTAPLLGIIGGMGMQATEHFCRLIISMQNVQIEQEYLDMLVYYKPSIPDRTAYIIGDNKENPLSYLLQAVQTLENSRATCLVMPCVTAHYFYDELADATSIPLLNIIKETANHAASTGYKKAGLLTTSGTIKAGLFTKIFNDIGISIVTPGDRDQAALMDIIYDVKKGRKMSPDVLEYLAEKLQSKGAEAIILGCTELSLLSDGRETYIDAMEVLAGAALRKTK